MIGCRYQSQSRKRPERERKNHSPSGGRKEGDDLLSLSLARGVVNRDLLIPLLVSQRTSRRFGVGDESRSGSGGGREDVVGELGRSNFDVESLDERGDHPVSSSTVPERKKKVGMGQR